jgi:hypothetical protein
LCCLNYLCGFSFFGTGRFVLPPALLYARYLLFRGNIRHIFGLTSTSIPTVTTIYPPEITDLLTSAPVSSGTPASVSLLFCPYDAALDSRAAKSNAMKYEVQCRWEIPALDRMSKAIDPYPKISLLSEFLSVDLQSLYAQELLDRKSDLLLAIKSTLSADPDAPDLVLHAIFGEDVYKDEFRDNLDHFYLVLGHIPDLFTDPTTTTLRKAPTTSDLQKSRVDTNETTLIEQGLRCSGFFFIRNLKFIMRTMMSPRPR